MPAAMSTTTCPTRKIYKNVSDVSRLRLSRAGSRLGLSHEELVLVEPILHEELGRLKTQLHALDHEVREPYQADSANKQRLVGSKAEQPPGKRAGGRPGSACVPVCKKQPVDEVPEHAGRKADCDVHMELVVPHRHQMPEQPDCHWAHDEPDGNADLHPAILADLFGEPLKSLPKPQHFDPFLGCRRPSLSASASRPKLTVLPKLAYSNMKKATKSLC
jgi:hypothetical protein